MKKLLGMCLASWLILSTPTQVQARADQIQLQENYPQEYVVVKGDTLWDISGHFLEKPWRWPELWDINPQIDDPHWIYPGDVLYLTWVNGQPKLRVKNDGRLQPHARVSKLDNAIPGIALKDLYAFLSDNVVLDDTLLAQTPYVLGGRNNRIISGAGDRIYARGEIDLEHSTQNVYRPAKSYIDPETQELLGYELLKVAEARVVSVKADITSLDIQKSREEVRVQDRVIPSPETRIQSVFYPVAAPAESEATILSVLRGVTKIGRYDAVAINKGSREGLKSGHVFIVYTKGETITDPVTQEEITLPSEEAGTLMVFKTFEKVSYGLVMTATNVLSVGDSLRSPDFYE
ncbi:LysM peptidoglycan-binding domain-containing protein [Neptunomonas antarctica]|uniref:LysM domain-containing protein n=1 Tax=Neptunomonas antarctica TaxID=619304 RepID=A0A1N7ITY3_9GAMM|nr:LysM peptidoglycan-binding domain-containing protein [Neptunomonas antarctica]SIS40552.1 LysM domain-containing protein [Neptunomonas antarctica]